MEGDRRSWRLPTQRQRDADVDRLRIAIDRLKLAAAAFIEGPAGFLSHETHDWLLGTEAVAKELATLAKPSRHEILRRGFRRPNEYREWLIGEQIPALYEKVFGGSRFPATVAGKNARGKRGMIFARHVLTELGETAPRDETIKVLVAKVRRKVRASETPT